MVVANRLPLDDSAAPDGACEWRRSPGGLAGALHILQETPATWVGWTGRADDGPNLPDIGRVRLRTVPLSGSPGATSSTLVTVDHHSGQWSESAIAS